MKRTFPSQAGSTISAAICSLLLFALSGRAYSHTSADWICGSGNWTDISCWNFPDSDPNYTPTLGDLLDARLIFSDNVDRVIVRSFDEDAPYYYQMSDTKIDATGSGTATLIHASGNAGQYNSGGNTVGINGSGTLIQTGGTMLGAIKLGINAGSSGTYNLINGRAGDSQSWVLVGAKGNGLVNQSGGRITAASMTIGLEEGGNGTYNLTNGILLMSEAGFSDISWIGYAGKGTFNQYGGQHRASTGFILGGTESGQGTYNMNGGSAIAEQVLIVGDEGMGRFTQTGGDVSVLDGPIGDYPPGLVIGNGQNGHGTYNLIDGTLALSSYALIDATIGNEGTGVFNQFGGSFIIEDCPSSDSSDCDTFFGTGSVNIAKQAGSQGTFNLAGGTTVSNGVNVGIGGEGVFNQLGGSNEIRGTLAVANASQNGTGVYNLKGGTLEADNVVVSHNGVFNYDGGSVTTDLFANGGRVTLGDPAVDTTIDGNFAQLPSGTLALAASYTSSGTFVYDRLDVTQLAILGGTLDFSWDLDVGDLAYGLGDDEIDSALFSFDLLSADTLLGEFDFLELPDLGVLDPLYDWNVSYLLNDLGTDYVRLSMVRTPSAVPEPSTLLLLLPGLAGLGLAGRRRLAA